MKELYDESSKHASSKSAHRYQRGKMRGVPTTGRRLRCHRKVLPRTFQRTRDYRTRTLSDGVDNDDGNAAFSR